MDSSDKRANLFSFSSFTLFLSGEIALVANGNKRVILLITTCSDDLECAIKSRGPSLRVLVIDCVGCVTCCSSTSSVTSRYAKVDWFSYELCSWLLG